jgi:hypothetical protein
MQIASHSKTRYLRFALWALAMLVAFVITINFSPRHTPLVPAMFIALFVPAVLMPLHKKNFTGSSI